jgi:hypothetical protein
MEFVFLVVYFLFGYDLSVQNGPWGIFWNGVNEKRVVKTHDFC